MKDKKRFQLFLVDDDALFLKSLQIDFFQFTDYNIKTFATGELCLEYLSDKPDFIILDYELDGINRQAMNGIQTLDKIKSFNSDIPVVMLSSQDKIEVAIDCMHHKAFDYIVKSETAFMRLQKRISNFLKFKEIEQDLSWYMNRM
jgi:two-component system OmpR family response regulator